MNSLTQIEPMATQNLELPPNRLERRKNLCEHDWGFQVAVDEDRCFYKMQREKYKMTGTHNGLVWVCSLHPNSDDHKMEVAYYRCTSKYCIRDTTDECPFHACYNASFRNRFSIFFIFICACEN